MGLNQKQKEAVEYLEGPLLVLAGPGTGKTQLLSEKVAYVLKNTDTNPENILCLTFTETGASNMRERLRTIVGNAGQKVNIGTYHAFGSDILAQYKNYSEEYDRKLDSAIDEVMQFKIVKNIQAGLSGKDILRGDGVKDIVSVISAAKSAGLTAEHLKKIAEINLEDSEVLSKTISPFLKEIVPRNFELSFKNAYEPIYNILQRYSEETPIIAFGTRSRALAQAYGPKSNISLSPSIERFVSILARDLKEAVLEAEPSEKIKPLSAWKDKYFEKDARGNFRLKDRVANKKLLSLAHVMGEYDKYLKENGLYDYDDMITEAVKVLSSDAGFKATLSERYQFIMLDEFQDTNPAQFAIIKALTDYEKPMIMAVGDDDQAIYEFQGALATNLTDFQQHYSAHVVALVENYRSTQEILDFSREVIKQAPDRFADKELFAHHDNPKHSQIYRHEFLSSDMEYGFIADKISDLVKSGVSQNEIAIISYKTKYFMPLLPFLKAKKNINIAYEKRDNLLEDERMHQIFAMAQFVYELANDKKPTVSALEVLSYPFFGLPIIEVVKLANRARADKKAIFDLMLESENPKLQQVSHFFADLIAKSFNEPLEIFLDYLIGATELNGYRSPLIERCIKDGEYESFRLYENVASLRGKLKRHFGDKSLRLADLIAMLEDFREADMPINTTSPYRDADEAVSVLSAHKAKGLEFSYVFIISADHIAWGKGKGNNNLLALPKNLIHIRHTGTTDGEKLRILYVALTRAKNTLFITNSLHDFNDKSPERLEYLEEFEKDKVVYSPFLPDKTVTLHYEASAYDFAENNIRNWLLPYAELTPDMRMLYKNRVKNYRMSASSLTSFIDIVYAGPQEFFKNYILQAPYEPESEALAYGDLVHKTFEMVTNRGISDAEAVQYFVDELEKKDLPVEVKQKIREKGPDDITVALKAFSGILRRGKAEVNLGPEKLSVDGVPVTGKIDHIIVDDTNKTIEIYDFKTGGYHKEKWQSHATLYKYMLQLGFYKLLLNNSPTYAKYKVTQAHILFVTPDKDGEVYDKVYEFNADDEKELLALIAAAYRQIESLEFIDDPELFVSPDNTLGIKDIKKFIALVLAKNLPK